MQKDQSDLGLIFKKRARRRLVGAIALVLLMVILLPIVLEDRTQTGMEQDIAIVMPDGTTGDEVIVSEEVITIEDLKAETAANTKKLTLPKLQEALVKTLEISALIMVLVAASNFFGSVFSRLGTPMLLTDFLLGLEMNRYLILAMIMVMIRLCWLV